MKKAAVRINLPFGIGQGHLKVIFTYRPTRGHPTYQLVSSCSLGVPEFMRLIYMGDFLTQDNENVCFALVIMIAP